MTTVTITTTDGEQKQITCTGVPLEDIDVAYVEQRTAYSVESITVSPCVEDRIEKLEKATGTGGGGKRGIAHRIDELEDRISDLENS
jgi:hypothetical protein